MDHEPTPWSAGASVHRLIWELLREVAARGHRKALRPRFGTPGISKVVDYGLDDWPPRVNHREKTLLMNVADWHNILITEGIQNVSWWLPFERFDAWSNYNMILRSSRCLFPHITSYKVDLPGSAMKCHEWIRMETNANLTINQKHFWEALGCRPAKQLPSPSRLGEMHSVSASKYTMVYLIIPVQTPWCFKLVTMMVYSWWLQVKTISTHGGKTSCFKALVLQHSSASEWLDQNSRKILPQTSRLDGGPKGGPRSIVTHGNG